MPTNGNLHPRFSISLQPDDAAVPVVENGSLPKCEFSVPSIVVEPSEEINNIRRKSFFGSDSNVGALAHSSFDRRLSRRLTVSNAKRISQIPTQPVYGHDWDLKMQPAGTIQYMHWTKVGNEVEISAFDPGLDGRRKAPVYRKKKCKYPLDATPEEAEFVEPESKLLDQWSATAICGNDITSSVIYTAGLVAKTAGYYTPFCLLLVVALLHLFRNIYVEVVTALPLNGGTYTAILNTTRKNVATIAACLSFLSYVATVVVSAASAMEYLHGVWHGLVVILGTIIVILLFAAIMLVGMKESAIVALIIFAFHLTTLLTLIGCSIGYTIKTNATNLVDHYHNHPGPDNPVRAIILGFATAMLGITGFESSANFVQHQKPGVFAKTLRNMWIVVALINPTVSVFGFAVIPYHEFYVQNITELKVEKEVIDSLLAVMAKEMNEFVGGGFWLRYLIIADAIIVLCGAVLTGYVGVVGLLCRMVDDDIFPRAWAAKLPKTGARYPIILFFALVCVGLVILTWGDIAAIGGVYTICFLCVMFLFCLSNLIMKHTRRDLKRDVRAKWYVVLICMFALIVALCGNCIEDPIIIGYAALFIAIFMTIFYCMSARTFLIRAFLNLTERMEGKSSLLRQFRNYLINILLSIEQVPVVFFSRRLNIREMNLAVQRVLSDELTRRLTIVHFYDKLEDISDEFSYELCVLDTQIYPNIQVDAILIKGHFGPGTVRLAECILDVPPNRMFIVSPSKWFPYNVAELGSVRIIMSRRDEGILEPDDRIVGCVNDGFLPAGDGAVESIGSRKGSSSELERAERVFRNRFYSMAVVPTRSFSVDSADQNGLKPPKAKDPKRSPSPTAAARRKI